jgi:hypothetical protein
LRVRRAEGLIGSLEKAEADKFIGRVPLSMGKFQLNAAG